MMKHTATVWLLNCQAIGDEELAPFVAWLGLSEVQRLTRFVRAGRRQQFLAGRALLRQLLGELLGMQPAAVPLVERPGNVPLLDLPESAEVGFSLSHSGHWVACAVSATSRLGLDVERMDESRDIEALGAHIFDAEHQIWLAGRAAAHRLQDFYELWSATEARFKLGAPIAHEAYLSHPELSVVLCSAQPLAAEPELKLTVLKPATSQATHYANSHTAGSQVRNLQSKQQVAIS
jgi:4'-phosphopantetheinyl transferase